MSKKHAFRMCTTKNQSAIISSQEKLWQIFYLPTKGVPPMKQAKEGDRYRTIIIDQVRFDIHYGYYEEKDRYGKYNDPIPIYPDLIKHPKFNNQGYRIVTEMQDKCLYYDEKLQTDSCIGCNHYQKKEDLIGICLCEENRSHPPKATFIK